MTMSLNGLVPCFFYVICLLNVTFTDILHFSQQYLDCLWAQIQKLKSDNWQVCYGVSTGICTDNRI